MQLAQDGYGQRLTDGLGGAGDRRVLLQTLVRVSGSGPRPAAGESRKFEALGIGGYSTHNTPMDKLHYERADYSVVVKNRAPPPKAWRWEIYRAGNANPIKQSSIYFDTTAAARRAGKDALKLLLNKLFV
jgi:hypothetical protein